MSLGHSIGSRFRIHLHWLILPLLLSIAACQRPNGLCNHCSLRPSGDRGYSSTSCSSDLESEFENAIVSFWVAYLLGIDLGALSQDELLALAGRVFKIDSSLDCNGLSQRFVNHNLHVVGSGDPDRSLREVSTRLTEDVALAYCSDFTSAIFLLDQTTYPSEGYQFAIYLDQAGEPTGELVELVFRTCLNNYSSVELTCESATLVKDYAVNHI